MPAANAAFTQLEAIAVTGGPPAVIMRITADDGDGARRSPEIPPVVGIIPGFAVFKFVAAAGAIFHAETVRIFTGGMRVVIVIGFTAGDQVVGCAALDVYPCILIGMRDAVLNGVAVALD